MKQILSLIGSMKTMAVLMLIFAFAIGYATIIENDFGTMTAKAEIYNARWFEVLLGLLTINLILNIYNYKMYTLKKAPIFIFHIAFLVILFGAAITRYVGYEGNMHIREGMDSSSILSAKNYLSVDITSGDETLHLKEVVYLSKKNKNSINESASINGKKVNVNLIEYIPNAVETLVEDKNSNAIAKFMVTGGGEGKPIALDIGNYYDTGSFILDFESGLKFDKPVVYIYMKDDKLYMNHNMKLSFFRMSDKAKGSLEAKAGEVLNKRVLYTGDMGGGFVLRDFMPHASKKLIRNPEARMRTKGIDAFVFNIDIDGKSKNLIVYSREGTKGVPSSVVLDGVNVAVSYGSIEIELPFKLKLIDFQLDRYPGSMSPASYASEVELIDEKEGVNMPFRIYMNHILEYKNYRFFQASYDQDEKGTVLSVNHDPGTLPTYLGYLLLAIGMFWSLFSKNHRFSKLAAKAKKANEAKFVPILLALAFVFGTTPSYCSTDLDPLVKTIVSFDKNSAEKFGELIVQDTQGRMKPINTLSTEILAKIHRSSSLDVGDYKLSADQVVLGMMIRPDIYKKIKLIRTHDPKVNEAIGVEKDTKYVSFNQFFQNPDRMQGYKIAKLVENATRKAPKNRNKLDKAVLKVDEKVNVVYMVFTGSLIKIWPKANDINNKWYATINALETFDKEQALEVRKLAVDYFTAIDNSLSSGDWSKSDIALKNIVNFQKKYGVDVYPSNGKIGAEIFYNKSNIFELLWPMYFVMGFILLILSFTKIIYPKLKMALVSKISLMLLIAFFIAHTMGLALRWYISGHAPWSNGFESMTYIAWATVLAGFIFSKRSPITLAATSILAGLILFVAHLSWMNPQVTNLVPVLNSYWLSIHVSMITGSYGFLGLGALLGFITIILFIIKTDKNEKQITNSIKELNAINEMSLMVGLVTLTIGNFLGGVWANESWGRYWGWDPKETWALVTILVYAVVVHLRFIKSIYSEFNYSVISLLSFTSVLMTYFGVNYYLAGMHSYAKGDPVPIPDFVPVTYAILFIVIALAFRNRKIV